MKKIFEYGDLVAYRLMLTYVKTNGGEISNTPWVFIGRYVGGPSETPDILQDVIMMAGGRYEYEGTVDFDRGFDAKGETVSVRLLPPTIPGYHMGCQYDMKIEEYKREGIIESDGKD